MRLSQPNQTDGIKIISDPIFSFYESHIGAHNLNKGDLHGHMVQQNFIESLVNSVESAVNNAIESFVSTVVTFFNGALELLVGSVLPFVFGAFESLARIA